MMKNKNKYIFGLITLMMINSGFAQQGEILVTASNVGGSINISYELYNEAKVSGLQFDIILPELQLKNLNISSCASIYKNSPLAKCKLKGNRLRVIVINPSLQEMNSGVVGSVLINGAKGILKQKLEISRAILFDNKGNEKSIQAILDYKDVMFLDENMRNNDNLIKK